MSTVAFISDLHLTPERPESNDLFFSFLKKAKNSFSCVYILGDLFDYWIGDDGAQLLDHLPIERALRNATSAGLSIYFIHGNRDFLIGENFSQRTGCVLLPDLTTIQLLGEKILLSHGDVFCIDDIPHQKSREVMLSRKWKVDFLKLTLEKRMEIAKSLRLESENNKVNKSANIMDVTQSEVESVMRQYNVTKLIHGHTHKPAAHHFKLGSQTASRYVLGDWYEQKSLLIYDNGNITLSK